MTRGLILVAVLLGATFMAHFFMADPGYVLLHFRGYAVELSVPGLLLFAVLAYLGVRLLLRLLQAPVDLGRATGRYRNNQARKKLKLGLVEAAEGNHKRAERLLAESAHKSDTPVLNYLGAARAAQEQGAIERRDNWLMMAYESDDKAARAVLLTQAQLQASEGDDERALATLRRLEEQSPGHPQALALLASIYERLGDWDNLRELLPQLRKRKAMTADEVDELAERTWSRLLEHNSSSGDSSAVERHWQAVPKALRKSGGLFKEYVAALNRSGEQMKAEQALRKAIRKRYDAELVDLYSQLETVDATTLLANVEGWLRTRPSEPALLLAAGRLSLRAGDHDKARGYLADAIKVDPSPGAYQVYGALLTETGDADEAAIAFRKGLALATGRVESTLPAVVVSDNEEDEETTVPDNGASA
ncbi:MAG: tetratricopeptide repeat protein [Gammaproteobacteria bacterium]|nr:tetratricopeptide repeat protein [Gammaproteobacteria bacterium]